MKKHKLDAKDRYGWYTTGFFLHIVIIYSLLYQIIFKNHMMLGWVLAIYTILTIWIIIPVISNNKKLRVDYKEKFVRASAICIISILLICLGFFLETQSAHINPSLDYNEYEFKLDAEPPLDSSLTFTKVTYDFKKQKGEITFILKSELENISNHSVEIQLPDEVMIVNTYVRNPSDTESNWSEYYNLTNTSKNHNFYELRFGQINEPRATVTIDIEGNLIPNGAFDFFFSSRRTWNVDKGIIEFDLGNYKCNNNCFSEVKNSEIEINNNKIIVQFPNEYYNNASEYKSLPMEFSLNTYDGMKEMKKNQNSNLSVALSVGGLIAFGEIFVIFFLLHIHPREYKTKKK